MKKFTKYKEDAKPTPEPIKPCTVNEFINSFAKEFDFNFNAESGDLRVTGKAVGGIITKQMRKVKSTEQARAEFLALKNKMK